MATIVRTEHNVDPRTIDLGDWPIVVALNRMQHDLICRAFGLNPNRTTTASSPRVIEGTRPTAIIYSPNWYMHRESEDIEQVLQRASIKMPTPPVVIRLREGEF